MRKLNVSFMTVLAFAVLSLSAFAANQNDVDSRGILLNPTLVGGDGSGVFLNNDNRYENMGIAGTSNNREENTLSGRVDNPTLNWSGGLEIFREPPTVDQYYGSGSSDKHYGLAPSWGLNKDSSAEVRMDNPTLHGIFENIE